MGMENVIEAGRPEPWFPSFLVCFFYAIPSCIAYLSALKIEAPDSSEVLVLIY
jgi:hypothetical protein